MNLEHIFRVNLMKLRIKRKWTQDELAIQVDKSRAWVTHVESGRTKISTEHIELFSDVFGVSPFYMLSEQNEIQPPNNKVEVEKVEDQSGMIDDVRRSIFIETVPKEGELIIKIRSGRVQRMTYIPKDDLAFGTSIPAKRLSVPVTEVLKKLPTPLNDGSIFIKYSLDDNYGEVKQADVKTEREWKQPLVKGLLSYGEIFDTTKASIGIPKSGKFLVRIRFNNALSIKLMQSTPETKHANTHKLKKVFVKTLVDYQGIEDGYLKMDYNLSVTGDVKKLNVSHFDGNYSEALKDLKRHQ